MKRKQVTRVVGENALLAGQPIGMFDLVNVLLLMAVVVLSVWPGQPFDDAIPTLVPVVLGILFYAYLLDRKRAPFLGGLTRRWLFTLFLLRLVIGLWINQYWWWPRATRILGNDPDFYEFWGWKVAQFAGSRPSLPFEDMGTTYYVGAVYSIFGHNPAVLAVTHSLLMAWVALGVFQLGSRFGTPVMARRAAILFSLLPIGLLYGAMPTKDVLVCAFYVYVAIQLEAIISSGRLSLLRICVLSLAVAGLVFTRGTMIYVLGLVLVLELLPRRQVNKKFLTIAVSLVVVLAVGLLVTEWREAVFGREIRGASVTISDWESMGDRGWEFSSTREASLSLQLYWDADWRKAHLIPIRSALVLFTPFPPFSFDNLARTMESMNVWVLLFLFPAVLTSVWGKKGKWVMRLKELLPCWAPLVSVAIALGAGLPYLQPRYALPAYPFFCVLAGIGLADQSRRLALFYALLPLGLISLFVVYRLAK